MPQKTKIIFITVFIIVGALILGYYYFQDSSKTNTAGNNPSINQPFNPLGSGTTTAPPSTGGSSNTGSEEIVVGGTTTGETTILQTSARFHKLTDFAVAGATYFEDTRPLPTTTPTQTTPPSTPATKKTIIKKPATPKFEIVPSLRYIERVTGHIYQRYLDTKIIGKISNSTIPTIYEALFDGKANSIIYRYLSSENKTISSFLATLGEAHGEFLPENISDIALSSDGSKFFYLTKIASGVAGTIRSFADTKKSQVFTSAFAEWIPQWINDKKIYLTTKASYLFDGDIFSLNTATGSLTKIFGPVTGLTTLANNDGSLILYSTSLSIGPKLGIFSTASHTSLDAGAYTLSEKCVWSADNITIYCAVPNSITGSQYPDYWYQGLISFDDHFVQINTKTGSLDIIADSSEGESIDATHLFLDKKENQLFFINKKDSTLWSLDLH